MKSSHIIGGVIIAIATTCLTGCVTPIVLVVRSQPASGVYETSATVAVVESAARKLTVELEAADIAALAGKAFTYSYSAHTNATKEMTLVTIDVRYVGSWTRTGFTTPNEKLDLFVKSLAVRTGEVLTPILFPAG